MDNNILNIKDSGTRREFSTGAVRDIQEGKGRCDLIPLDVVSDLFRGDDPNIPVILNYISCFQKTGLTEFLIWAVKSFINQFNAFDMLLEISKHYENGAKKYGENNWQKGIPIKSYIDSAVRHYFKWLRGDNDEPHDRAFCWNLISAIWTCRKYPVLNDYRQEVEE